MQINFRNMTYAKKLSLLLNLASDNDNVSAAQPDEDDSEVGINDYASEQFDDEFPIVDGEVVKPKMKSGCRPPSKDKKKHDDSDGDMQAISVTDACKENNDADLEVVKKGQSILTGRNQTRGRGHGRKRKNEGTF